EVRALGNDHEIGLELRQIGAHERQYGALGRTFGGQPEERRRKRKSGGQADPVQVANAAAERQQPANARMLRVDAGLEDRDGMPALGKVCGRSGPKLFAPTPRVGAGTEEDEAQRTQVDVSGTTIVTLLSAIRRADTSQRVAA